MTQAKAITSVTLGISDGTPGVFISDKQDWIQGFYNGSNRKVIIVQPVSVKW